MCLAGASTFSNARLQLDVMPKRLGPTSGAMDGESEEAEQQERSLDGGATSGSEALCRAQPVRHRHRRETKTTL
jgi:hypothetical protein